MKGAYKNDIKTTHQLTCICIYIYNWVRPRDITIPSPYLCIVLSALCTHIQQNFKNPQKDVGILPALHPHAPK
jgi:hypothetical protein